MDSKTAMLKGIFHLEDKSVFMFAICYFLMFIYLFISQKREMEALMAFDVKFNAQLHA